MAAFVVSSPALAGIPPTARRLSIFPGAAIPAVFPAGTPFWVGYGFVPEPSGSAKESQVTLDDATRFELTVDGEPVPLHTDVTRGDGHPVSKHSIASFDSGLPAGWHRFEGRWYDSGTLVLTSDRSIQFVERS
jgi:hypothetical protein